MAFDLSLSLSLPPHHLRAVCVFSSQTFGEGGSEGSEWWWWKSAPLWWYLEHSSCNYVSPGEFAVSSGEIATSFLIRTTCTSLGLFVPDWTDTKRQAVHVLQCKNISIVFLLMPYDDVVAQRKNVRRSKTFSVKVPWCFRKPTDPELLSRLRAHSLSSKRTSRSSEMASFVLVFGL